MNSIFMTVEELAKGHKCNSHITANECDFMKMLDPKRKTHIMSLCPGGKLSKHCSEILHVTALWDTVGCSFYSRFTWNLNLCSVRCAKFLVAQDDVLNQQGQCMYV